MKPELANYSTVEALRDGRRMTIRALQPEDRAEYLAALERVSNQSLRRRFFAIRRYFTTAEQAFFLNPDFVTHVALVAIIEKNGSGTIAGGARFVVEKPREAEVAFTVVDQYQGLGIGSALLRHVIQVARKLGLDQLVAEVLPSNAAMLKVFERAGVRCTTRRDSDSVHVTLSLLPQDQVGESQPRA